MQSATAKSIAESLGGHRTGACWMARCPAHDDGRERQAQDSTADPPSAHQPLGSG
jgi:hypothetical protein